MRESRTAPNAISTTTSHLDRVGVAHVALDGAQEAVQAARLGAARGGVSVEVPVARPGGCAQGPDEVIDVVHAIMVARE
jgi:hypothetical protein